MIIQIKPNKFYSEPLSLHYYWVKVQINSIHIQATIHLQSNNYAALDHLCPSHYVACYLDRVGSADCVGLSIFASLRYLFDLKVISADHEDNLTGFLVFLKREGLVGPIFDEKDYLASIVTVNGPVHDYYALCHESTGDSYVPQVASINSVR